MVNSAKFNFKQKIYKYIKILIIPIISCISGICLHYGYVISKENSIEVPGTIISNLESIKSPYKSTRIYTNYGFVVKPDHNIYKNYYVCVDPTTFVSYNVGDHVTFEVRRDQVDPKGYNDFLGFILFFVGFIGAAVVITYSIYYVK